jgi:hypothetical protein
MKIPSAFLLFYAKIYTDADDVKDHLLHPFYVKPIRGGLKLSYLASFVKVSHQQPKKALSGSVKRK